MEENRVAGRPGGVPVLAGFDAVRRLGGGAQAEVWLVRPHDGGTALAAKCFPAAARADGAAAGAVPGPPRHNATEITQEWRILAQYDHEHLLRLHGLVELGGAWQGGCALLMDHAAGGSVQDLVGARGPLSVGECVTILTPLGQVLSHLHGRGAVHGDVSPGNVLLTVQGKPVLGDPGLGRLTGQAGGRTAGTPGFFCLQDEGVCPESDVYGMAAVGWFALTGHVPPATRDRMPLGVYARNVPDELAAALEAGLSGEAAQRPTAAAFAQAVFRSAPAEPVALAQSVHASVLPDLVTRRETRRRAPKFLRPVLRGLRNGRPLGGGRGERGLGRRVRTDGQGWHAPAPFRRTRGRRLLTTAAPALILVLILAGAGFTSWGLLAAMKTTEPVPATAATPANTAGKTGADRPPRTPPGTPPVTATGAAAGSRPGGAPREAAVRAALGQQAAKLPAPVRDGLLAAAPEKALAALAWVRSYALSTADVELLETVNAPGSPAMASDAGIIRALARAGHSYNGLETNVAGAAVTRQQLVTGGSDAPYATATVLATVTTSAYAEQDAHGAVVFTSPQEQKQRLAIVLVQVRSRWVVQQILPGGG
ncbi:protein kinase [Arthrobacter sp. SDTb3-6]|uniref:serine/threonine protein kinase n=1 Tax=Arthrobacter sp. SDTb3-6 TaxID=2713571 RepID=UPI00159D8DA3|nr:protein kinase [Arthrobacter sp. SDTb3-6]NVN00299.1 protein kinase [Arthrobacter sp. SDTb3-6]